MKVFLIVQKLVIARGLMNKVDGDFNENESIGYLSFNNHGFDSYFDLFDFHETPISIVYKRNSVNKLF